MIVGILSDTHDRVDAMADAMELLRRSGAEFFIHCGDVGSERCSTTSPASPAPSSSATPTGTAPLCALCEQIGVACYPSLAELELGGKKFAVTHGDDFRLKQRLLAEQRYDYLLQGHTHLPPTSASARPA